MSDETRQFSPFDGDGDDDDRTKVQPSHPSENETRPLPRQDDAAWAGRAQVRPPGPGREVWTTDEDDWAATQARPEPRGKWWTPIVVGIVALLLLGALGWGVYLIATNTEEPSDSPSVPPISAPTVQTPRTTAPATTQPTTTPPTTEPTTTEPTGPTEITVPALLGLSQEEAEQALNRRGLKSRSIFRPSDNPAGTVIDSDPAEGQEVPPGTQVTLVIATPRVGAPSTGPTPPD
jgi:hypothetical protein